MVIIFRALGVKRGSISRWMILWRFSCLYVAISVIIKDLYAWSQVFFLYFMAPISYISTSFFENSCNFFRLRQYISEKWVTNTFSVPTEWLFSLPPFSFVVKEGVALLRELAVIWHGLQSGEDLLEHWPFLNQNTSICFSNENIHVLLTCMQM